MSEELFVMLIAFIFVAFCGLMTFIIFSFIYFFAERRNKDESDD